MKLEQDEEEAFVAYLGNQPKEALALKLKLLAQKGWPDRTVFCEGHLFFIEFKREKKGIVSPQQRFWRKTLKRLGFNVYVCTSAEQAIEIFKKETQPP